MKKWKKWAAATMAGMMAASSLTACGAKQEEAPAATQAPEQTTGAPERDTGSRRKFWPAGNSQIFLVGQ